MSQPEYKKLASQPIWLVDDDIDSEDTISSETKAIKYVTILESKGCFMYEIPSIQVIPEDVKFCKRLLDQPVKTPQGTFFEKEFSLEFYKILRDRSKTGLLVNLHPLLMPTAETQFIKGIQSLRNVVDSYNDVWDSTESIIPDLQPQPDHAKGLCRTTFSETHYRKLGIEPNGVSPYMMRDDMLFPYLTAEVESSLRGLQFPDIKNMQSMSIALRAVVCLAQTAGCPEDVHRRILGFSISHEFEEVRICGYYPEIDEDNVKYIRREIATFNIWKEENKWLCYRFVENLDREFLPIHINRIMYFLSKIPDPREPPLDAGVDLFGIYSHLSRAWSEGSQEQSEYLQTEASQNQSLDSKLHNLIQALHKNVKDQEVQKEKLMAEVRAQKEKFAAETRARAERFAAEFREQEERFAAEAREQEETLATLLKQKDIHLEKLASFLEKK